MAGIEQLELDLPNGFHDAELCGVNVDYERGEAVMIVNVDVSDSDATSAPQYKRGALHIHGLVFISIDVPDKVSEPTPLWLTSGAGQPSTAPVELPTLPSECFLHWFFVNEWNGFIRVAARHAEFTWNK